MKALRPHDGSIALLCVVVAICWARDGNSQAQVPGVQQPAKKLPVAVQKALETAFKRVEKNRETYEGQNEKVLGGLKRDLERVNPPVNADALIVGFQQKIMELDAAARPPAPPPPEKDVVVFQGHRYKLFQESLSWNEAKAKCEAMGGQLLILEDKQEWEFISTALEKSYRESKTMPVGAAIWLGIKKKAGDEKWTQINGQPVTFSAWNGNRFEPSNDYAIMSLERRVWDSVSDEPLVGRFFVCEWDR